MSQFLKYVTKKMQGGGDIGSLPGVLSLSAIQKNIKLNKDIKNQKALNSQATLSQYTPKPGDQERMNRAKDRYRTELTQPLNRLANNPNVVAAAKNLPGAAEFALNAMTAGEAGAVLNTIAKPALKAAGRFLTKETALKNAYKLNPYAFKPSEGMMYRGLGKEGMEDAFESGVFRAKQDVEPSMVGRFDMSKRFNKAYFSPKFDVADQYGQGYIAEVPRSASDWGRRYGKKEWSQIAQKDIPITEGKILQKDWLKGYKQVSKPDRIPTSFYSEPVITRGPIANPWDGKGIRVEMEGSLDVPEGMMPYIGRVEYVPTTPAEKVYASFFQGKPRPIPPPYKKQRGGTAYVDSVFNAPNNKQLEWVQRLYQKNGKSIMVPGQTEPSTHFMQSGDGRVYPTVVTMPDGSLKYLGKGAYDYADSTKTYIQFPTDKQAQWFGKNYKTGTGVLSKKKGGPIVDPRGQWAHPGKVTRIPGSDITMQGVSYPVYGVGSNGQKQMMYPGQEYDFGGASYVDEYPIMQGGGLSTGPIMPMINPIVSKIAEWFSGPSNKKSKSPKSLYQTQTEVSNKRYNDFLDKLDSNDDKNYDSSSRFVNLSAGRFKGAKVALDMINDIVAAAKANNVDPWVMLSLVGRESTFGSGIESNKERANNKQQLLSGWDVAEDYMPYDFDRYLADKKVPGMNVYKSKQGYFYGTDDENIVEQYLQKHPELIEGYNKKLASTPDLGNMDSFNLAAKRIKKKGIAKYNPGDPKYTYMVNQDMQLLKRDPELRAYMQSIGYQMGGSYPMMQRGGSWNKFYIPKAQLGLTAKDRNNIIGYIQKLSKNKSSVQNSEATPVSNSRDLSKQDMQRIASMSKLMVPTNTREALDAERKEKYGSQWEAEKIEDKRKKQERKTAAITRSKVLAGDDDASFTFPDGTTKKWKDMDWREQSYISGKNLGSLNNDNWTDYINPFAMIGSMAEGMGTAPYEAKKTESITPYLFGVGVPFLTGGLGSLGAKNVGQFVENTFSPIPANLSSVGRYLTEKTPLRHAYKLNRSALTDDMLFNKEGVVNRQIFGDDAYNNFLKYGPTTRPNISQSDQLMELVRAPKSDIRSVATDEVFQVANTMEDGAFKYPYFQEGNLWYTGQQRSNLAKELGKERIITTPKSDLWFAPAGEATVMTSDDISKGLIDSYSKGRRVLMPGASEYAKPSKYSVFEPHWWKGYKQIQEDGGQIYPMMQGGGSYRTKEKDASWNWLNPLNWGVPDYSDKGNFDQAYALARKNNDKQFMYGSKRIAVKDGGKQVSYRMIEEANPQFTSRYKAEMQRMYPADADKRYQDMLDLHLRYGNPKVNMVNEKGRAFFSIPSNAMTIYANDPIGDYISEMNHSRQRATMGPKALQQKQIADMKRNKVVTAEDYDNTMYDDPNSIEGVHYNYDFPLKMRMMYRQYDLEQDESSKARAARLKILNDSALGKFDPYADQYNIRALQRALHENGYALPGSIKADNTFDGIYGKETKAALEAFKRKQPKMESGGQHGGLDRWFAEKWVDVKTGKDCGRQDGEKRKGYPACRPSRRVNEDTPKTASELSSSEREKFKREKTSSERINYQHRRKEYGGETNEQDMANKPNNPALWSRAKSLAKSKFDVYPSAYANGWAAKWYKGKGGTWSKAEYGMEVMGEGGTPDNAGFRALPPAVQQKIMDNMAEGGEKMPPEIARARFAAAGNLDKMSDYGYGYGGYIPEVMAYGGPAQQAAIAIAMKKAGKKPKQMKEGGDPDGEMALGQIDAAIMKLSQLRKFIQPESDLEPWVNSKLTLMDDYASAVSDYMMHNPEAEEEFEEMGMMAKGGYVVTRSNDRKGKTHKVTGPDGTVKYFGDSKLGQHPNDPERKAAFYARHEKNLKNNPHFRAFARKTWADGGEIEMMANGGYIGHDGRSHMSTTPTWSGNMGYKMGGGMPCYECGGMFAEGGMYDCPDQEKDPVTGKCAADVARGKEAAAANKAANADMNAWAKQVAAMDRANAKQDAAQYAGQMSFDYDWMGFPVDKAEKKAAMAQYKQFLQQNPNVFVADDTSGFNPEQKYIIASKLKQKASTPLGSKAFQQKFKQDPNFFDLKRLQSDIVPMMGGWDAARNYLFGNKKYGGPAVGAEMDVTPEQLEALRKQGYEFEII